MTTRSRAASLEVPGVIRRAAGVFGDLFLVVGIVLCVPFVIMAIGIPLALCVRLLFWVAGLL